MSAALDNPVFKDAELARQALEALRWPEGPTCPHCGSVEKIAKVKGTKKSHRPGLYYCNACKGQFTVTVGTVFEDSKVPLNKWWMAVFLLCDLTGWLWTGLIERISQDRRSRTCGEDRRRARSRSC